MLKKFFVLAFLFCIGLEAFANSKPVATDTEVIELQEGMNLKAEFSRFQLQDKKSKSKNLSAIIGQSSTLIALVKPGCVFCEAFLAVANSSRLKTAPKLIVISDSTHASLDEFKKLSNKFTKLNAIWLYDKDDLFYTRFGIQAFPRFLYLNSKQDLVKIQLGLVVPEDKAALEKEEFAIVLQKLAINTVNWVKTLK